MVLEAHQVGEGYPRWVGALEEVGDHLEEGEEEVEGASCPQEEEAGEVGTYQQNLAWVEEAQGHRGDRGRGEGRQEQQLLVSAGKEEHQGEFHHITFSVLGINLFFLIFSFL